ncbi:MAG: DUF599 domain-containing protein [Loktanella sp.]|jgi:uncharacterized membrane protein|nr:DUF599 domain-containing protein [Loktanella sp.]
MTLLDHLALLTLFDAIAAALIVLVWCGIGWRIEHPGVKNPSVTMLMSERRRDWMKVLVTRDSRIFDSQILGGLREATAFFASTSLFAIGGVLALLGNTESLRGVAAGVSDTQVPVLIWQLKLALVALFLTNGFLKFVWSNRVFGYCAVVMASVPNDAADPLAYPRAAQAAELNIRAALNFNRGLRSMYFALAALAWLAGPGALVGATLIVAWIIWSREFASLPRNVLMND